MNNILTKTEKRWMGQNDNTQVLYITSSISEPAEISKESTLETLGWEYEFEYKISSAYVFSIKLSVENSKFHV